MSAALSTPYRFGDPRHAFAYDELLAPRLFAPWAEELAEEVGARPGERALDVATGTGVVARELARRIGASGCVLAFDVSRDMLAIASEQMPDAGAAIVTYLEAAAESLPFGTTRFDVVTCQQGLQYMGDRLLALRGMHASMTAGGRLGASMWRGLEECGVFDALARALADCEPEMVDVIRMPFSGPDELTFESELAEAGFEDTKVMRRERLLTLDDEASALGVLDATPLGVRIARLEPKRRARLATAVAHHVARYRLRSGAIVAPMAALVATARAAHEPRSF